ncbi:4'-phosphopantetheinyl transferase family protein [Nonlabens xiamenensis]|uniref:4'-phosphopantetheinyl transferase family protein n=1 Tax=Nonlabens xiamenensis TaxID=2341043 RepID=UPI000F60C3E9|nr:4'-phosphopantetheinyl transferase superfamily protein [Nonlabens xiamenensis]
MPLYQSINNRENTQVLVWKVTETEAALRHGIELSNNSLNRLSMMSSELHRRGFLSIRHLLIAAGYTDLDLHYTDDGKPHLNTDRYISITHSFHFTAIAISDAPIGIDIEKQREKITRIAPKFIGYETEFVESLENPIPELTVVWGAKESMYKLYGQKGLGFKDHCHVESFDMREETTISSIHYHQQHFSYEVFFQAVEDFVLVYILPDV